MSGIEYLAPASVQEAVKALGAAKGNAKILAGGTDLLVQMRGGRLKPQVIIDLKRIPGMLEIKADRDGFLIGAATPGVLLGEHEALRKAWPGVVEAAILIGSTQVQGRASLGGNLCNASPAADSVPALIAAEATCIVEGPKGRRELSVEKVQAGPGKTTLAMDEILLAFRLPARPPKSSDAYLRLIPRSEMDIAVVGAAVSLTVDVSGKCVAARVSVGAVAPRTLLVEAAGAALAGSLLSAEALSNLEAAVTAACKPISDKRGTVEYRRKVAGVLARRAASIAFERARA